MVFPKRKWYTTTESRRRWYVCITYGQIFARIYYWKVFYDENFKKTIPAPDLCRYSLYGNPFHRYTALCRSSLRIRWIWWSDRYCHTGSWRTDSRFLRSGCSRHRSGTFQLLFTGRWYRLYWRLANRPEHRSTGCSSYGCEYGGSPLFQKCRYTTLSGQYHQDHDNSSGLWKFKPEN